MNRRGRQPSGPSSAADPVALDLLGVLARIAESRNPPLLREACLQACWAIAGGAIGEAQALLHEAAHQARAEAHIYELFGGHEAAERATMAWTLAQLARRAASTRRRLGRPRVPLAPPRAPAERPSIWPLRRRVGLEMARYDLEVANPWCPTVPAGAHLELVPHPKGVLMYASCSLPDRWRSRHGRVRIAASYVEAEALARAWISLAEALISAVLRRASAARQSRAA